MDFHFQKPGFVKRYPSIPKRTRHHLPLHAVFPAKNEVALCGPRLKGCVHHNRCWNTWQANKVHHDLLKIEASQMTRMFRAKRLASLDNMSDKMLDKLCFTDYGYWSTVENYDFIPHSLRTTISGLSANSVPKTTISFGIA